MIDRLLMSLALAAALLFALLWFAEHSVTTGLKRDAIARGFATWEIDREDGREVFTWKEPAR